MGKPCASVSNRLAGRCAGLSGSGIWPLMKVFGVTESIRWTPGRRISVFDKDGRFLEIWAVPCRGGLVITPDDTVYVSDVNTGAVTILKNGKILDVIHVEGRPHGLAVDPTTLEVYTSSSVAANPNVSDQLTRSCCNRDAGRPLTTGSAQEDFLAPTARHHSALNSHLVDHDR